MNQTQIEAISDKITLYIEQIKEEGITKECDIILMTGNKFGLNKNQVKEFLK